MVTATAWLDRNKPVEQMTWAPGLPMLIRDQLISEGGWIERKNVTCFNLYRPPTIKLGDAADADPWLDHVRKVYPDDADHIIKWCAHRVQRPQEKINHALVLGGAMGIGKDTLLEPVKHAVGPWNFHEVSPQHLLGRFNGFLKSVILRVSEARDLGDVNRFQFYDHMKAYTAAPPDVLRVDEKNLREHCVLNCVRRHHHDEPQSGRHLSARRRPPPLCGVVRTDQGRFHREYWNAFGDWYGDRARRTLPPISPSSTSRRSTRRHRRPRRSAFWDIVDASRAPEDAELADVLDKMGNPDVTTFIRLANHADGELRDVDQGSQEPPRYPAPAGKMRLRPGAQRRRQ